MVEKSRSRNKAARPNQIVQAALECFLEKGYGSTTFADIAVKAKIARSTVYLYYKSKTEVFRAVINYIFSKQKDQIEEQVFAKQTDFISKIMIMEKIQIDLCNTDYFPNLVLMLLSESSKNQELADIWYEETFANIKKIWKTLCADQEFSEEQSQMLFTIMISTFLVSSAFGSIFKQKNPLPKFNSYLQSFNQILPAILSEYKKTVK